MLKHHLIHRGITAHVVPGAVASSVGVLALYAAAHRYLPGNPWVETGVIVGLSAVAALVLVALLKRFVMRPVLERLELAEATLERAMLMQDAMKPALSLLAEGLARHYAILDDLSAGFSAHEEHHDGAAGESKISGLSRRLKALAATVKDLRKDAASRAQIANTLLAANETVGLRHTELHDCLGDLRSAVTGLPKRPQVSLSQTSHASDFPESPDIDHRDEPLPPSAAHPDLSDGPAKPGASGAPDYSWPAEPFQPLMSDFRIPKTQNRDRFGRN